MRISFVLPSISTIFAFGRKMDGLKISLVFDRKSLATDSHKQGVIEVYVYDPSTIKKVYLSTGIEVLKNQFEKGRGERGRVVKHPNKVHLNGKLDKIYREIEAFSLSDKCNTLADIKNWDAKPENTTSIVSFIEGELKRRDPSLAVIEQNKALTAQIKSFERLKTFSNLTYENIVDFDAHLKINGIGATTRKKRHSLLRGYIREAINRGLCTYDPYMTFRPEKGSPKDPVFLTEEELEAIRDYDFAQNADINDLGIGDRLIKVRDVFVFQCFTGLAYVDLKAFNGQEDISEIEGQKVIRSNREKTEQGYITVLLPDAISVLEKYDYQLPVISNQKYNDYLKLLALYIVDKDRKPIIKKRLTTHVARHTCGTYLLNKGVPMETVARMLGHANTKMTRHYAKLLGTKVVNDVLTYVINPQKK